MNKRTLTIAIIISLIVAGVGPAYADMNPALAFTLETFGGYGGGFALGIAGIPVGNLLITREDYAGGGLIGFAVFYPIGCGLAVYGVGEAAAGDSPNDAAALGASLGAAGGVMLTGYLAARWKGVVIGLIAAPVASAVAYNIITRAGDPDVNLEPADGLYISYSFGF
ncbi:MAG: hypothetical protein JSW52_02015 [Candidatus Coatesbacteria bacterium]|nr:MAG: hypothetical protein JSW52_02015 [Candidatus Coatesbacteria bacterium]